MADQRFRGSAVDLARCCRRGAGLRPDAQDQHRQAACPLVVPAGLHALRSHPDNAGNQAASADAALLSNAARPAALRRRFRTGLINEGSREDPTRKNDISEPTKNRATGTWTIYLVHRVSGPNGEFLGLILGAMEMRYFEAFY